MTTVNIVPAAPKVSVTVSAKQAHALLNFLNQFYIPKEAKCGLAGVREALRESAPDFVPSSTYTGVPTIETNRGTKAYRLS